MYSYFEPKINYFRTYLSTFSYIIMLFIKFFCNITNAVWQSHPTTTIRFMSWVKSHMLTSNPLTNIPNLPINCVPTFFNCKRGDVAICKWAHLPWHSLGAQIQPLCICKWARSRLDLCWCLQVSFVLYKHMYISISSVSTLCITCKHHVKLPLLTDCTAVHRIEK